VFEALGLLSPVVTAGATVGATAIKADAQKYVARQDYKANLATTLSQERLYLAQSELDNELRRVQAARDAETAQTVAIVGGLAFLAWLVLGEK
jgi:uncharacterized protein (UPF0254 family)